MGVAPKGGIRFGIGTGLVVAIGAAGIVAMPEVVLGAGTPAGAVVVCGIAGRATFGLSGLGLAVTGIVLLSNTLKVMLDLPTLFLNSLAFATEDGMAISKFSPASGVEYRLFFLSLTLNTPMPYGVFTSSSSGISISVPCLYFL